MTDPRHFPSWLTTLQVTAGSARAPRSARTFASARTSARARGFTLVELLGALTILGILAALTVAKMANHGKGTKLNGEARALFSELGNARSQVIKRNLAYLVRFDAAAGIYMVYEDKNGNGAADIGEEVRRRVLDKQVAFGAPASGPPKGPSATGIPKDKVEGAWKAAMVIGNDRMATMNLGSIYLYAPGIPRVYCIRMPANTRRLEMWRWDGSKWSAM